MQRSTRRVSWWLLGLWIGAGGGCTAEPEPDPVTPGQALGEADGGVPADAAVGPAPDGGVVVAEDAAAPPDAAHPLDLGPGPDPADPACLAGPPTEEALALGGVISDRAAIIPGGRMVTPDGQLVRMGHAALGLALSADGSRAYVTCDGEPDFGLAVVELATATQVQLLTGFEAFRGLQATADGRVIVAGSRSGRLFSFVPDAQGQLQPGPGLELAGYLGDLTLSPDGQLAYVVANTSSTIFAVELATMTVTRTYQAGNYPYDLVLDPTGSRLFVSNLAGNNVSVIDLPSGELVAEVPTRKGPEGMALDPVRGRLYVPCADDDVVVVIDSTTLAQVAEFDLSHHPQGLLSAVPTEVALSPDGDVLYVVQSDLNQVDLVDAENGTLLGSIPTGWYPVAVQAHPDGRRLLAVSAKGLGSGGRLHDMPGLLQVSTLPATPEELAARTRQAWDNNTRPTRFFRTPCESPLAYEDRLPLEHVVLIVRENKTYDMVLGDLEGTNGDPALTLFGEEITPSIHRLARTFTNLDNFYSNPESSIQGHVWTTQATCNDFVEKLYFSQLPLAGFEPASIPSSGTIFEHCLRHGVSFRNYGEVASFGPEMLGRMRDFIDPKFPFFNMGIRDEDKAREVIREWNLGIFPQFIYIGLPNDHTYGATPGKPTPESMVADNDRATGMLVEWITRSRYWDRTIVFIIEDDPQSWRGDHVDPHRSLCVVVSPWVKRGYVSSVHYSIPSIYRTFEMILGLPPLNKNDALAAPMYDIFRTPAEGPDLTPFEAPPLAVPHAITPAGAFMARESLQLKWRDGVDGVAGLGHILWRVRKGLVDPPAYGKGIDE